MYAQVAIKEMKLSNRHNKPRTLVTEILVMKACEHPNLIGFIDAFLLPDAVWVCG